MPPRTRERGQSGSLFFPSNTKINYRARAMHQASEESSPVARVLSANQRYHLHNDGAMNALSSEAKLSDRCRGRMAITPQNDVVHFRCLGACTGYVTHTATRKPVETQRRHMRLYTAASFVTSNPVRRISSDPRAMTMLRAPRMDVNLERRQRNAALEATAQRAVWSWGEDVLMRHVSQ